MRFGWVFVVIVGIIIAVSFAPSKQIDVNQDWSAPPPWPIYYVAMAVERFMFHFGLSTTPPPFRIMSDTNSYVLAQAIVVAAELSLADHLGIASSKSTKELAALTNADPNKLCRLLHCLSVHGYFEEDASTKRNCTFRNNVLSSYLMENHSNSMKAIVLHHGFMYNELNKLRDVVKTSKPFVSKFFEELESDPIQRDIFARAMKSTAALGNEAIVRDYPFSQFSTVADMGGGIGALLVSLLKVHPTVHGVLFDLAGVISDAEQLWKKEHAALLPRATFIAGDFFNASTVPTELDAYLFRGVVHDWNDEQALKILTSVRTAMGKKMSSRLILAELTPTEEQESIPRTVDMIMMTIGGVERTVEQWKELLSKAGFQFESLTKTRSPMKIIVAKPI